MHPTQPLSVAKAKDRVLERGLVPESDILDQYPKRSSQVPACALSFLALFLPLPAIFLIVFFVSWEVPSSCYCYVALIDPLFCITTELLRLSHIAGSLRFV